MNVSPTDDQTAREPEAPSSRPTTDRRQRRVRSLALLLISGSLLVTMYVVNPDGRHYAMAAISDLVDRLNQPAPCPEHLELMRDAAVHLYEEEWDEAFEIYEKLCVDDPDVPDAWYGMGLCLQQFRDHHGAIEAYRRAVTDPIVGSLAEYRLATQYVLTDQDDLALDALDRAFRTGFRDVDRARNDPALNLIRDDPRFYIPPAPEQVTFTTAGGERLSYFLVLPRDFDPNRSYPTLLAFSGSTQDQAMTGFMLDVYWGMQAHYQEWIVVAPMAVSGRGGFAYADDHLLIPELLDDLQSRYLIEGDRVHLAGYSNGGSTIFKLATQFPDRFQSVTALPVYEIRPGVLEQLPRLEGMTITLLYGELDTGPSADSSITLHDRLAALDIESTLTMMRGEMHHLTSLTGDRFMAMMEHVRDRTFAAVRDTIAH